MEPAYNLVIGLAGPIGSGCSTLATSLKQILDDWAGCHAINIKVADVIGPSGIGGKILRSASSATGEPDGRRRDLQNAGTRLRLMEPELVAKLVVNEIRLRGNAVTVSSGKKSPATLVFIVDSLKNRNDVVGLRRIFRDEFVFVFNSLDRESRWQRSKNHQGWTEAKRPSFDEVDAVDWDEQGRDPSVGKSGQETGELAQLADYFVVNNRNRDDLKKSARRLIDLLMGGPENSQPTNDEQRMHMAFSAAMGSGCLSRQVGAALFDAKGDVIGLGHNDVPKPTGGLYSVEDGASDHRCYLVGDTGCRNEALKRERFDRLADSLSKAVEAEFSDQAEKPAQLASLPEKFRGVIRSSPLRSATEYCRAVHAEMSALLGSARSGAASTRNSTMYVTTFPCHNCAKHLLCAGVKRVVYAEPYAKSLATDLHLDALTTDAAGEEERAKTILVQFEGVAPRRYIDFFIQEGERKDSEGKAISRTREQRASEPRFASRVRRRARGDLTPVSDPISFDEVKVSVEVSNLLPAADRKGEQAAEPTTGG